MACLRKQMPAMCAYEGVKIGFIVYGRPPMQKSEQIRYDRHLASSVDLKTQVQKALSLKGAFPIYLNSKNL